MHITWCTSPYPWSCSVRWCLAEGIVCWNQRRRTGSGNALESCSPRCAIQICGYFTLQCGLVGGGHKDAESLRTSNGCAAGWSVFDICDLATTRTALIPSDCNDWLAVNGTVPDPVSDGTTSAWVVGLRRPLAHTSINTSIIGRLSITSHAPVNQVRYNSHEMPFHHGWNQTE